MLATSQGNILDNMELVESLNETKAKSVTIAAGLEESRDLHRKIDEQRDKYRPVADR